MNQSVGHKFYNALIGSIGRISIQSISRSVGHKFYNVLIGSIGRISIIMILAGGSSGMGNLLTGQKKMCSESTRLRSNGQGVVVIKKCLLQEFKICEVAHV